MLLPEKQHLNHHPGPLAQPSTVDHDSLCLVLSDLSIALTTIVSHITSSRCPVRGGTRAIQKLHHDLQAVPSGTPSIGLLDRALVELSLLSKLFEPDSIGPHLLEHEVDELQAGYAIKRAQRLIPQIKQLATERDRRKSEIKQHTNSILRFLHKASATFIQAVTIFVWFWILLALVPILVCIKMVPTIVQLLFKVAEPILCLLVVSSPLTVGIFIAVGIYSGEEGMLRLANSLWSSFAGLVTIVLQKAPL